MAATDPVLVIGAGIGGLTAALSLARHGVPVQVYEQAPQLGEIGAGLTLYPNAMRGFIELGVGDELHALAMEPLSGALFHYQTAEALSRTGPRPAAAGPATATEYRIHRADMHEVLASAVERAIPGGIHLNKTLVDLAQRDDGVEAIFADGSLAHGRALVGADGIRSAVRGRTFGFSEPRFTGYVAWRGLVPTAGLPTLAVEPMTAVWRGPNHMFVRYQVRGGTILNYVAFANQPGWEIESWTERSEVSEVLSHFADWHPAVRAVIEATDPGSCFKWALFDREPMPTWTDGLVTLLGDAAHPMVPFIGQAACCASEDGYVLGRALGSTDDVRRGLQRYQDARMPRAASMQALAWDSRFPLDGSAPDPATVASPEYQARVRRTRDLTLYDPTTLTFD